MIIKKIDLYEEYKIERKEGYNGYLYLYYPDLERKETNRKDLYPAMLVIPGGAYEYVSEREGEPIALYYLAQGFVCATLYYTCKKPYPRELIEAMLAMKYLKEHASEYYIREDKIASIGFSAGGNLCGLLSTIKEDEAKLIDGPTYRPDLSVLAYAVVSGAKALTHEGSIINISMTENRDKVSVEKRVDNTTPPMFIWHTISDDCVPYKNSVVLRDSLAKAGIECELVLFDEGEHGLSTSDYNTIPVSNLRDYHKETSKWKELSLEFLREKGFTAK